MIRNIKKRTKKKTIRNTKKKHNVTTPKTRCKQFIVYPKNCYRNTPLYMYNTFINYFMRSTRLFFFLVYFLRFLCVNKIKKKSSARLYKEIIYVSISIHAVLLIIYAPVMHL